MSDPRIEVVIITCNRQAEVLRTVGWLSELPERPLLHVVDNGDDGAAAAVRTAFPGVDVLEPGANMGAVGRNLGVERVHAPYVAFCDDDTWWEPGSLALAADLLDEHPDVAALTAHITVEPSGVPDPIIAELRNSPVLGRPGLPGPALGSILAGASVLRVEAFRAAGGFHPRLWLGGEEELLCADLAAAGWWLVYAEELRVHHQPSRARDARLRRRHGIRNTLWTTWLRRPVPVALRRTSYLARTVPRDRTSLLAFCDAARGARWVRRERRTLPPRAEAAFRALEASQRASTARRYVG